jgi:preprotein translocase subunit SecB
MNSVLHLNTIYFSEITFSRTPDFENWLKIYFDKDIIKVKDNSYDVTLTCLITNGDNRQLDLKIALKANFEVSSNSEAEEEQLFNSMIAIMYPYMRSQITLVTCQPNLNPINLPVANIHAMFEKL